MPDQAREQTTIAAPLERVYEVAIDIERYPDWARDVKEAEVVERDGEGRPLRVAFRAAAMGHSARYTLRYDHEGAPQRLAWELDEGDIVRRLDGEYRFAPTPGDGSGTEVTYQLTVELAVPLPGFVKRRAETKIVTTALAELKARAEAGPI